MDDVEGWLVFVSYASHIRYLDTITDSIDEFTGTILMYSMHLLVSKEKKLVLLIECSVWPLER